MCGTLGIIGREADAGVKGRAVSKTLPLVLTDRQCSAVMGPSAKAPAHTKVMGLQETVTEKWGGLSPTQPDEGRQAEPLGSYRPNRPN